MKRKPISLEQHRSMVRDFDRRIRVKTGDLRYEQMYRAGYMLLSTLSFWIKFPESHNDMKFLRAFCNRRNDVKESEEDERG
jgi:hypothetical protein